MSYILEALKKSEQERHQGRPPDLRTHHAGDDAARRPWLPWALSGVATLLAVAALLWAALAAGPVRDIGEPASGRSPVAGAVAGPDATTPAPPDAAVAAPPPVMPVPARQAPGNGVDAGTLDALLAELEVSAHVYSSDAGFRTITINGEALREGDTLGNGVRVLEITPHGARIALGAEEQELVAFP